MMKAILIEAGVILLLIILIYFFLKRIRSLKNDKKQLESELSKQKDNLLYLYQHSKEISKIAKSEKKYSEEIGNAKTDEEILSVISDIISDNNSRVCEQS